MERRIAYYLYDGDRKNFVDKLTEGGFKIPKTGVIFSSNNKTSLIGLAVIGETYLMIHPVLNNMNEFDISERSRLIKICDEFKTEIKY